MTTIIFTLIVIICLILAIASIIYVIVKSYTYKTSTIKLIQGEQIVTIPLNKLHSITAVSQGQVLVTTILQEQFVGVLVKV